MIVYVGRLIKENLIKKKNNNSLFQMVLFFLVFLVQFCLSRYRDFKIRLGFWYLIYIVIYFEMDEKQGNFNKVVLDFEFNVIFFFQEMRFFFYWRLRQIM